MKKETFLFKTITGQTKRLTLKHDARVFEVTSGSGLQSVSDIKGRLKSNSQLRVLTTSTDSSILNTTYNNSIVKGIAMYVNN